MPLPVLKNFLAQFEGWASNPSFLSCFNEVFLEREFRPMSLWSRDQPCMIPGCEKMIGRHDDPIVSRVQYAFGVDRAGRKLNELFSPDGRGDIVGRDLGHFW